MNTLSTSISNSLIEFKKLSNTNQDIEQEGSKKNEAILSTSINSTLSSPVSLSDIQTTLFFKSTNIQNPTKNTTTSVCNPKPLSNLSVTNVMTPPLPPPVPQLNNQTIQPSVQKITSILNSKFNQETAMKSMVVQQDVAHASISAPSTLAQPSNHYLCPHGHDHRYNHHHYHQHPHNKPTNTGSVSTTNPAQINVNIFRITHICQYDIK